MDQLMQDHRLLMRQYGIKNQYTDEFEFQSEPGFQYGSNRHSTKYGESDTNTSFLTALECYFSSFQSDCHDNLFRRAAETVAEKFSEQVLPSRRRVGHSL
jgi:hypothetical protein